MITITQGKPGNGKSYFAGVDFLSLLTRAITWEQKGIIKVRRKVATNIELNKDLYEEFKDYIVLWDGLDELIKLRNCDVVFDDMGTYLDAQEWTKINRDVKRWFRLHEHYGCDIYGNCQDFKDIANVVRKLTSEVKEVTKLVGSRRPSESKPKVKMVWGIFMTRSLTIDVAEKPNEKREYVGWPRFDILKKKYCNVYNTLQDIVEGELPPLKHLAQYCGDQNCYHHRVPKVSHV